MDEKVADHTSSGTPIKRCRRGRGRWVPLVRWTSKEVRHRTEGKTHDRPGGPLLGSRRFPPAESSVGFHVTKTDKLVERKKGGEATLAPVRPREAAFRPPRVHVVRESPPHKVRRWPRQAESVASKEGEQRGHRRVERGCSEEGGGTP